MIEVKHNDGDVARMRAEENLKAEIADQNAKIDFLALMADIEFPDGSTSAVDDEEDEESEDD